MASPFQRQAQIRKVTYAVLILALFTGTLFWRQYIEQQADRLELREQNQGEVELSGSAIRLLMTGSRGVAITVLWVKANKTQMKHEWNKLELLVSSITKLQPHYIEPWKFQSWNLAWNVTAECDRIQDKYYFITRGTELMAQGERQNRDNPNLRFEMGRFYLSKIGTADENQLLRCLFQLSCIDPLERDPKRLRKPDGSVDLKEFKTFCEKHPFLVRRLHDTQSCATPDDVLDFLAENYELPCRYEYPSGGRGSRLKPPEQQYPVLPRRADLVGLTDAPLLAGAIWTADDAQIPDDFDNFSAAALWFMYSQAPLPPPDPSGKPMTDYDRSKFRMPGFTSIIFRSYIARAQSYVAVRTQKEGWFDRGWEVDEGQQGINRWFPGQQVVLGNDVNWSQIAWERAWKLWEAHGRRTGLHFEPEELAAKKQLARAYREAYGVGENELGAELRPEDTGELRGSFEAHRQLFHYHHNRASLTNFPHFLAQARVERLSDTVTARRLFFKAQQLRKADKPAGDIARVYKEALVGTEDQKGEGGWVKVLQENDDFRKDMDVQEETYKLQYEYLQQLREEERGRLAHLKPLLLLGDFLAQAGRAPGPPVWLPTADAIPPRSLGSGIVGPFDGNAKDGQPFFTPAAIRLARERLGLRETPPAKTTAAKKSGF
jgi:hypothetical protein